MSDPFAEAATDPVMPRHGAGGFDAFTSPDKEMRPSFEAFSGLSIEELLVMLVYMYIYVCLFLYTYICVSIYISARASICASGCICNTSTA